MNKYNRKDPLCYKVYNWEDGQVLAESPVMSLTTIRRVVGKACRYYGVRPAPQVRLYPKARTSFSLYGTLGFVPKHLNPIVVLHEAAHYIADKLFGGEYGTPHSDEWFGIYCWLLIKFEVYEPAFLRGSLKPYRLTLKPLGPDRL